MTTTTSTSLWWHYPHPPFPAEDHVGNGRHHDLLPYLRRNAVGPPRQLHDLRQHQRPRRPAQRHPDRSRRIHHHDHPIATLLPGYSLSGYGGLIGLLILRFAGSMFMGGEYTSADPLAPAALPGAAPRNRRRLHRGRRPDGRHRDLAHHAAVARPAARWRHRIRLSGMGMGGHRSSSVARSATVSCAAVWPRRC